MGITIDEAIKHGEEQLEIFGGEHKEFIETSIDTMRKYQKIKEIVSSKTTRLSYEDGFRQIKEVVEDGNDD